MNTSLMLINCFRLACVLTSLVSLTSTADAAGISVQFSSGAQQRTLIELYTSQGCSSCPPAEMWLGRLKEDPRLWHSLIPVAFHVDYWDHLGWHDTLATAAYSLRQRRYHRQGKLSAVYTPAFVVNGKEWHSWFGLRRLPMAEHTPGNLFVSLSQGVVHAKFTPADARTGPLLLHVAILGSGIKEEILAGENRGRELPQDFSVLDYHQQRSDTMRWVLPLPLLPNPAGGRLALAAWVSQLDIQGPLQATGGWLPSSDEKMGSPH